MTLRLSSRIASAAFLIGLSMTVPAWSTPLDIMVEDAAAPQSQKDGTGYANDIVRAAFAAAGIDVNLLVVPYTRCKASVMAGKVAACFSMSWDPQFKDSIEFADKPLFIVHPRYYRRTSAAAAIQTESAIPKGAVVGLVSGYEYPASFQRLHDRGVTFEYANSEMINLRKLSAGRIDFAVLMLTDIKTGSVLLNESGMRDISYAFEGDTIGAYIGFSNHQPQGETARELFNRGYARIIADGTLQKITEKWRQKSK
jgi:polar amino acid transport system substrate-binding protein